MSKSYEKTIDAQNRENISDPNGDYLLRLSQIIGKTGMIPISRAAWYAGMKDGRFPKPVKLGARAVAWRASDIAALVRNGGR